MNNNEIVNTALDWVEKMETSTDPGSLRPELEKWLLEDARHRSAYLAAQKQWAGVQKAVRLLKVEGTLPREVLNSKIEASGRQHRYKLILRRVGLRSLQAAAVGGACVLVAVLFGQTQNVSGKWVSYAGVGGVPQEHILDDGSGLFVSHDAEVNVRMGSDTREVALRRGELFVHVQHGDKRKFIVRSDDEILQAIGTEFDVRRDAGGELAAIVREGKIAIGRSVDPDSPKISGKEITVRAGEVATISHGNVQVVAKEPDEIDNQLSWLRGKVYLNGTLTRVIEKFNEHNTTKLRIDDPSIGNISVKGLYDAHGVREFAQALRARGVRCQVRKEADSNHEVIALSAEKNTK